MAEAAGQITADAVTASRESGSLWVGRSIPRVEDSALLTGRGRFIDQAADASDFEKLIELITFCRRRHGYFKSRGSNALK